MGQCCWDTSKVLINPGWVTWVRAYDVERLATPNDLRNITKDLSQLILGCIFDVKIVVFKKT